MTRVHAMPTLREHLQPAAPREIVMRMIYNLVRAAEYLLPRDARDVWDWTLHAMLRLTGVKEFGSAPLLLQRMRCAESHVGWKLVKGVEPPGPFCSCVVGASRRMRWP